MNELVRRDRPYRDSLMSTLGTASGLALVVGVPTAIVAAVAVYTLVKVFKDFRRWKNERSSGGSSIGVIEKNSEELPMRPVDIFGFNNVVVPLEKVVSNRKRRPRKKAARSQ